MELGDFIDKYKNKIFNIGIIILVLIISSNIYKKQLKEIEVLGEKIELETKKNQALESIIHSETRINTYKNLLAKKDTSLIINTISNIARESRIKIVSIRPMPERKYEDYIKVPFSLILSASEYHAVGRFISKLESSQDVYTVESMEIKSEPLTKELAVDLTINSITFAP